jgi:hypothetical protein
MLLTAPRPAIGWRRTLEEDMSLVTITLEIRPEVQADLARKAAGEGRAIEALAARHWAGPYRNRGFYKALLCRKISAAQNKKKSTLT